MVATAMAGSVVAHPKPVVAQRTTTRATTDSSPGLVWRIEINRRKKAKGGYSYHWLYRFGRGPDRRAVYGGTADQLIALNPARWAQYLEASQDE